MFKIDKRKQRPFPVAVEMFTDTGSPRTFNFDATFEVIDQFEIDALRLAVANGEKKDADVVDRVFVGWDKVEDEDGTPLAVNGDNRRVLLGVPGVKSAIVQAWLKSIGDQAKK